MAYKKRRFVVQEHTTPDGIHWDLMLEMNNVLMTYRLEKSPNRLLKEHSSAEKIADHSLKFLTYQGTCK